MPTIPVPTPLGYVGVFFVIAGIFLVIGGLNILKIEKLTVATGRKTWITGLLIATIGILFLLPEIGSALNVPVLPKPTATPVQPTPTPTVDFTIFADRAWQDSGVNIETGDMVSIKYLEGTWQIDPTYQAVDATGYFGQSYSGLVQDAPVGALLAHVGNGKAFLVGTSTSYTASDSGRLYLQINDGLFSDNSGSVKVQIGVSR